MSPERIDPEMFGLKTGRPTRSSDCYALGMVVYEVLSGHLPFHRFNSWAADRMAVRGIRPEIPQGVEKAWFTDEIWGILECCWKPASDRPSINCVLQCLEKASGFWTPLTVVGPQVTNSPSWDFSDLITSEES